MKLTTKGRFAVTAMLDLAIQAEESDAPIPIAQVADRQKISLPYLEQIFCRLRRAGLVESTRGPGGGYRLAESAQSITIDRIILAAGKARALGALPASRTIFGKTSTALLNASLPAFRSRPLRPKRKSIREAGIRLRYPQ